MQIFYLIMLLIAIGIAIFAVQNSNIPLITMKFLIWRFETSLIYTILGSIGIGILMSLFFWIPRTVKTSIRSKGLRKEIRHLKTGLHRPTGPEQERTQFKAL